MRRMTIAALALLGIFVALYLTLYKLGVIGHLACGFGSCERVNTSPWASFLGMPVAAWGLAFYVATFAVAVASTSARWADRREPALLLFAMCAVGFIFSMYLTYLELYVIKAICRYCVVSAIIATILFVVSALEMRAIRAPMSATRA